MELQFTHALHFLALPIAILSVVANTIFLVPVQKVGTRTE